VEALPQADLHNDDQSVGIKVSAPLSLGRTFFNEVDGHTGPSYSLYWLFRNWYGCENTYDKIYEVLLLTLCFFIG
jgi:hypothetical protein